LFESVGELSSHVRPATGQGDRARPPVGKGSVAGIAIALDGAGEVHRDKILQAGGGAAGFPAVEDVAAGAMGGPQVALFGLPFPGDR